MQLVTRAPAWWQFAAWALCGVSTAFTVVGAFAVGPLAIVPAILFALLALWLGGANVSAVGAASGAGAWGFVLGWMNRDGPGDVCTTTTAGGGCTQEWAPWPFWLAGALLVVVPVAVFAYLRRRARQASAL